MSKERDLLEAMRNSLSGTPITPEIPQAASAPQSIDWSNGMDVLTSLASSMANDPLFYAKVLGLLVLTVIVIMVSFELIASGA